MADIKQAARWLKEGKAVRLSSMDEGERFIAVEMGFIEFRDRKSRHAHDMLEVIDLLADDWEIAPEEREP